MPLLLIALFKKTKTKDIKKKEGGTIQKQEKTGR